MDVRCVDGANSDQRWYLATEVLLVLTDLAAQMDEEHPGRRTLLIFSDRCAAVHPAASRDCLLASVPVAA